jgi:polyhydroxyalkanoate synthesis regulator phasin
MAGTMPSPEQHIQSVADLMTAAGGGTIAGAAVTEIFRWLRSRGKENAEAEKLSADAQTSLNSIIDNRIKLIMETDQNMITAKEEAIKALRIEIEHLWRYINDLRNKLIRAHIEVPEPPLILSGPARNGSPEKFEGYRD